jgi:dephospho-CoA kinase
MKVIGIAGVAGSGKDLFHKLLSKELDCRRFSLGDELKEELKPYCLEHFNIDPTNCSREDKDFIRPSLVSHASIKRKLSNGRYWIEKVDPKIKNHYFESHSQSQDTKNKVCCITDIRYCEYEHDEVSWLKNELNGVLVHISLFKNINSKRVLKLGANEDEKKYDPLLKELSDFSYECEFIEATQEVIEKTLKNSIIRDFVSQLKKIS